VLPTPKTLRQILIVEDILKEADERGRGARYYEFMLKGRYTFRRELTSEADIAEIQLTNPDFVETGRHPIRDEPITFISLENDMSRLPSTDPVKMAYECMKKFEFPQEPGSTKMGRLSKYVDDMGNSFPYQFYNLMRLSQRYYAADANRSWPIPEGRLAHDFVPTGGKDNNEERWLSFYEEMISVLSVNNHVPMDTMFDGINLYNWCFAQRRFYANFKAGTTPCEGMTEERAGLLEALGWRWMVDQTIMKQRENRKDDSWTIRCQRVAELKNEEGAEFDGVPSSTMFDGINLYKWCFSQRDFYVKFKAGTFPCGGMNEERAAQLESLEWNFIVGRDDEE